MPIPNPKGPPNRIPWPPLIYFLAGLVAVGLGWGWPGTGEIAVRPGLGGMLVAVGAALDLWAMATMRRHRTNILPHRAATALVTSGPFAWSRNPIYLGNTVMLLGFGLVLGNPWFLLAGLAAAFAVTRLAIKREEVHLAALFGPEWDAYRQRTRRWIGRSVGL